MKNKRVFIVTGERSGDMHGANLARAILEQSPSISVEAMGGSCLAEAGATIIQDIEGLAVVGAVEVLRHLPKFKSVFDNLVMHLVKNRPDALILVDYPGFNLRLAAKIKSLLPDTKIIYYITPQVWAWHKSRLKRMRNLLDLALVIFEFEKPLFEHAGIPVKFVGHPLLDIPEVLNPNPLSVRRELQIPTNGILVGLLPGSRRKEIERMLPVMLDSAKIIANRQPDWRFVISCADSNLEQTIRIIMASKKSNYPIISDRFRDLLSACDVAAVTSGTATLEAAIQKKPMVVLYKMSPLSYSLARLLVRIKHISLVNIIADRSVVPELIQGKANANALAETLTPFITEATLRKSVITALESVRNNLGTPGASARAAKAIIELISG